MNQFLAGVLILGFAACVAATKYSDCGSTAGEVKAVEVHDCPDDQDVCILKRGTKAVIKITFNSKSDSKSLKTVVHGVIAGVPIPFPVPQPDACKSGVDCPVKNGQAYTYNNNIDVRKTYPPVSVTVKYQLMDENGAAVVCVTIPSKLE